MKKLINNLLNWVRILFFRFKAFYREHGKEITTFIGKVRLAVESQNAQRIVDFTHTEADNKYLHELRDAFKKIYSDLPPPNGDSIIADVLFYLNILRDASPILKSMVYIKLASLIFKQLVDEPISDSDADTFVQLSFKMNKEGKL